MTAHAQESPRDQRLMLRLEFDGGAFLAFFPATHSAEDLDDIQAAWHILMKSLRRRVDAAPPTYNPTGEE